MKKVALLCAVLSTLASAAFGQTIDPDFTPIFRAPASGQRVVAQPDDKLLVSGTFNSVGASSTRGFARLLPDGALDATFTYDPEIVEVPRFFALQADGKVVIAGRFHDPAGNFLGTLLRLQPDGSLDGSFTATLDPDLVILGVEILPNQKIYTSYRRCTDGQFSDCSISGLNLYLPDGGSDPDFAPLTFADFAEITSIARQSDNALLVFGGGLEIAGAAFQFAYRLDSTGVVDPTFNPIFSANVPVGTAAVLPDGTIGWLSANRQNFNLIDSSGTVQANISLIGRYSGVTAVPATASFCLTGNFLAYGSTTTGFSELASAFQNGNTFASAAQSGGVVVVGSFREVQFQYTPGIFRFSLPGGSFAPDPLFQAPLFAPGRIRAVVRQGNGKVVVGGTFDLVNGQRIDNLVRLHEDGSVDESFIDAARRAQPVNELKSLADGTLVVAAGQNTEFNSLPIAGLSLLSADGNDPVRLDFPAFQGPENIRYLAVDSIGRFYAGSSTAYNVNGEGWQGLVRYSVEAGSVTGTEDYNDLYLDSLRRYNGFLATPAGKLLIYGGEIRYDGSARAGIVRAETSGTIDESFLTDLPNDILVEDATLAATGEIFVAATLPVPEIGYVLGGLYKLSAEGTVAADFTEDFSLDGSDRYRIGFVRQLPTGAVLVSGPFDRYRNVQVPTGRLLLQTDGEPIGEFLPELAAANLELVTPIDSNSIYLAGSFVAPNGAVSLVRVDLPLTSSVSDRPLSTRPLDLYPNPVVGSSVNCRLVDSTPGADLSYHLFDLASGRQVRSGVLIGAADLEIPIPDLPTGSYVLLLREGARIHIGKLIKG